MQKKFKVIFSPPVLRAIQQLAADTALQLAKDIKSYLETSPLPIGKRRIKKLTGYIPPLYRLRSGDFRAYYRILSDSVVILAITHKKESEKFLKRIK
ncbi:MAG: type II toxin-antitoxin system RelE/ParE family toxin [Nitrospirae bacterium]|nr:type II toxin-antitoxin system RelE/ParE family toxin [Nitrospirota bacterium]